MQTVPSQGLGPVCSALDYCPKAVLGRERHYDFHVGAVCWFKFPFKPGRDCSGGDAFAGLESRSLCDAHTSVLAAV